MPLSVWYIWCAPFIQMDHEGIISSIEKSMWCASSTQSALEATNYGREEKYPKLCMQQQYTDPLGSVGARSTKIATGGWFGYGWECVIVLLLFRIEPMILLSIGNRLLLYCLAFVPYQISYRSFFKISKTNTKDFDEKKKRTTSISHIPIHKRTIKPE